MDRTTTVALDDGVDPHRRVTRRVVEGACQASGTGNLWSGDGRHPSTTWSEEQQPAEDRDDCD